MRFTWVCLSLLAATLLAGGADAYVAHGRPWPGGVIRLLQRRPRPGVGGRSGPPTRGTRAAPASASSPLRRRRPTSASSTSPAWPARSTPRRRSGTPRRRASGSSTATTARRSATRTWRRCSLAHEFGHVLGLEHETRGCSLMNPGATLQGPDLCPKAKVWQWRCKLLTRDDIAGAVALYGGAPRGQAGAERLRPLSGDPDANRADRGADERPPPVQRYGSGGRRR